MKILLIFLVLISGCVTTTLKTESDVSRMQFLLLPEFLAINMAEDSYREEIKKAEKNNKLNTNKKELDKVKRIAYKLIDNVSIFREDAVDWNWEINIQESEEVNAYCMPGGKIMVLTGILKKTDATEDEIAAILGHEISHALREHGRERMSTALVQHVGVLGFAAYIANRGRTVSKTSSNVAIQAVVLGTTLFFALPNGREQEREADKMGIELSARAGFNPMAAVSLWRKMGEISNSKVPEFLSTHPSNENRIADLTAHAKKLNKLYLDSKDN
jgi:predicted Zn-dependent protease